MLNTTKISVFAPKQLHLIGNYTYQQVDGRKKPKKEIRIVIMVFVQDNFYDY